MRIRQLVRQTAGPLLNVVFFIAVFVAVSAFQARNMLPTSGAEAPALGGPLLSGGTYDIATAEARPKLVYFFAPWCSICALTSDNLTRLRRLRDEESLDIVAVALDWQDVDEVSEYVERHEIDLPVILGDSRMGQSWQVYAFPTYYVLDSDRRIRRRDLGYSSQFGLWWRTWFVD